MTTEARREGGHDTEARGLPRFRAMILLAGSVRATAFAKSIGRSILDLPIEAGVSLLESWLSEADLLARWMGLQELSIRLVVDRASPKPVRVSLPKGLTLSVERDPFEYRGTAGVLADLCADYSPLDHVLVASATQVPREPVTRLVGALGAAAASVRILASREAVPASLMLIRCDSLRVVPRIGYADLKEQALPKIAEQQEVRVVYRERPVGAPILSLAGYIGMLRDHHHRLARNGPVRVDPFREDWKPAFTLIEDGGEVEPGAVVHDSVVLRGGRVESGALVARSLVAGVARGGRRHLDEVVGFNDVAFRSARGGKR